MTDPPIRAMPEERLELPTRGLWFLMRRVIPVQQAALRARQVL
jgi:hypothetical protein